MNLISQTRQVVTTETYEIEINNEKYTYIEYLKENGKVIDVVLRDSEGNDIGDGVLLERVQQFIDSPIVTNN